MNTFTEKPSWDDAPHWATHLLFNSFRLSHLREFAWAEKVGRLFNSSPAATAREVFCMAPEGCWTVLESRPEAPASAESARCGRCHFAGPVEMRMCLCRRHAPAGTRNPPHVLDIRSGCLTSSAPAFPIMAAERDWCGDFQPAAATEGANA